MTELLEILKYILPALIVFFTSYYLLNRQLKHQEKIKSKEISLKQQQVVTPLKLQAYERLTLFLERISPESLIMRLTRDNKSARQFQAELLNTIRSEYSHNVSQQIYVSGSCWEIIRSAKENTIKLINKTADSLPKGANAHAFSKVFLTTVMEQPSTPSKIALDYLKKEIQQYF